MDLRDAAPSRTRFCDRPYGRREPGGTAFFLYETEFAGQAGHTIAQFHVPDVGAEVKDLQSKGVTFEHYDLPGVTWDGDIASMGDMGHAAWFKDSEDNILCLDDVTSL